MTAEKREAFPLSWPDGWPRTRPQDQRSMASWKKTANQYREALAIELERMGSPVSVISTNVQLNVRNMMTPGVEPRDVGVAIYFSRKPKDNFAWQDALGIKTPYPTEDEIQSAVRPLLQRYHPDRGGDIAMFQAVIKHRDNALRWLRQQDGREFDYVIACDQFKEVRLNMAAIVMSIRAIRQLERCGTTSILERAFAGFKAITESATAGTVAS